MRLSIIAAALFFATGAAASSTAPQFTAAEMDKVAYNLGRVYAAISECKGVVIPAKSMPYVKDAVRRVGIGGKRNDQFTDGGLDFNLAFAADPGLACMNEVKSRPMLLEYAK